MLELKLGLLVGIRVGGAVGRFVIGAVVGDSVSSSSPSPVGVIVVEGPSVAASSPIKEAISTGELGFGPTVRGGNVGLTGAAVVVVTGTLLSSVSSSAGSLSFLSGFLSSPVPPPRPQAALKGFRMVRNHCPKPCPISKGFAPPPSSSAVSVLASSALPSLLSPVFLLLFLPLLLESSVTTYCNCR